MTVATALFGNLVQAADFVSTKRTSLRDMAQRAGISFGTAVQLRHLQHEPDFAQTVSRECNLIVPEGSLKWSITQPKRNHWDFSSADNLLQFAERNQMKMRGHTLIWEQAFPEWAQEDLDRGRGNTLMESHIHEVMGHYKGKLLSWDIVNEAVASNGDLKENQWFKALGSGYIEKAFRLAHEADPSSTLVYNDYILPGENKKRRAILDLLRSLLDRGVPIHALGIQSHLWAPKKVETKEVSTFCREVKAMGLDYYITELDVGENDYDSDTNTRDRLVAEQTRCYLEAVFSECIPKEILTWGLSTRHSWMTDPRYFKSNKKARPVRGLPFDAQMKRTLMGDELYRLFASLPEKTG